MKRGGYIRRKPISPEQKAKNTQDAQNMWQFYMEIWKERPHTSQISGNPLGDVPKSWMFDHLLEKSKYPEFSMMKDNIILLTFAEHEVKTMGNPLPKHKELVEDAKQRLL